MYFDKKKAAETDEERKEKLRRLNRLRVQKHRLRVRKMLLQPVVIPDYGEKGEYECIRDKNIQELERLKKESGLFD